MVNYLFTFVTIFFTKVAMSKISSVQERVDSLVEQFANGNKTAFAKEVGTLPSVLASIVGGRMSKPSFELLEKIMLKYPEISGNWLLTGQGPMLIPTPPARVQMPYKPPGQRKGSEFFPPGATDHLEEFRTQQSADFHYLIEVGNYLGSVNPSDFMRDFTARLPYTLNPDYDPNEVEPGNY